MRRVGDERAGRVEDGAGEVEPLLDVDRVGRVLERHAHLLGNRHEEVVEDLQHHRVCLGAEGGLRLERLDAGQHDVVEPGHLGLPAGLHHHGLGRLDDEGRALHDHAGPQLLAQPGTGLVPGAVGEELDPLRGLRRCLAAHLVLRLGGVRAAADALHLDGLHDDRLVLHREAELCLVRPGKSRRHVVDGAERHEEHGVGAVIAQVRLGQMLDGVLRQTLARQLRDVLVREPGPQRLQARQERLVEPRHDGSLPVGADVGEAHAIGREHAGQGMDEHLAHAERVGHQAGVLAAGAAEAVQGVAGDVVAALHRDLLDRIGHVLHRDGEEALSHFLRGASVADLGGHGSEGDPDCLGVERLVLVGAEDLREKLGPQLAEHHVGVGDRQPAASAVADGPRIGAGALRADAEARAVVEKERAAAGRDRVDAHHRRADAHARHLRLEGPFERAVIVRDVGRGTAHVEADHAREAGHLGRARPRDDAAGRAGQDRVLALEEIGRRQPAGGLHEHQPRPVRVLAEAQLLGHLRDVAAQDRREIGVDHRGVAAPHQLDERRALVADRDLCDAHPAHDLTRPALVLGMLEAVHEDDGDGIYPVGLRLLHGGAQAAFVERPLHRAVGAHPLVDLHDALVEHLRQHDLLGEDVGPRLVGDAQRVAKTLGDEQERPVALALQERVGRDRGAHLHRADRARGNGLAGLQREQLADAVHRRVAIGFGVLREHLVQRDGAVGPARHDVGECAAPVDPEVPLTIVVRCVGHETSRGWKASHRGLEAASGRGCRDA